MPTKRQVPETNRDAGIHLTFRSEHNHLTYVVSLRL